MKQCGTQTDTYTTGMIDVARGATRHGCIDDSIRINSEHVNTAVLEAEEEAEWLNPASTGRQLPKVFGGMTRDPWRKVSASLR